MRQRYKELQTSLDLFTDSPEGLCASCGRIEWRLASPQEGLANLQNEVTGACQLAESSICKVTSVSLCAALIAILEDEPVSS